MKFHWKVKFDGFFGNFWVTSNDNSVGLLYFQNSVSIKQFTHTFYMFHLLVCILVYIYTFCWDTSPDLYDILWLQKKQANFYGSGKENSILSFQGIKARKYRKYKYIPKQFVSSLNTSRNDQLAHTLESFLNKFAEFTEFIAKKSAIKNIPS